MQFMKSKSITFVLLVTFVMSWTGIAFAFVPAPSTVHSVSMQTHHKSDSEHCGKLVDMQINSVNQHNTDLSSSHCEQVEKHHVNHQNSHVQCQDCSTLKCHNSVSSFNLLETNSFNFSAFNSNDVLNTVYGIFHSSDFKQDILRPPQA